MVGANPFKADAFRTLFDSMDLPSPIVEDVPLAVRPGSDTTSGAFSLVFDPPPVEKTSFKGPPDPRAHARAEYERFNAARRPEERRAIADALAKYGRYHTDTIEPRVWAGRMYLELNRTQLAQVVLKSAYEAAPDRLDVLSDLRIANARLEARRIHPAPNHDAPTPIELQEKSRLAQLKKKDRIALLGAIAVAALMIAGLHSASVEAGNPHQLLFWARLGGLMSVATFSMAVLMQHRPLIAMDFLIQPKAIVAAIGAGVILGLMSMFTFAAPLSHAGLLLGAPAMLCEVLATELFFRGFLGRLLYRGAPARVLPVIAGGLFYGAFQLTSWGLSPVSAGVAVLWGLTLAAAHQKTRSLVPPAACALSAHLIVLVATLP